jgi:hypothetical protein
LVPLASSSTTPSSFFTHALVAALAALAGFKAASIAAKGAATAAPPSSLVELPSSSTMAQPLERRNGALPLSTAATLPQASSGYQASYEGLRTEIEI